MAKLLLIRHADAGAGGRILGRLPGWHLSPAGLAQAISLATLLAPLPLRAVYSSPLERTLETALMISEPHGLTPECLEDLNEIEFGDWSGHYVEELDTKPEWKQYNLCRTCSRPPGGESILGVQHRILKCLNSIAERRPDELVAVVSHGDPLRCAVAHYLGMPVDLIHRFEIACASVTAVELTAAGPCLACLNFTNTFAGVAAPEGETEVNYGSKNVSNVV